MICSPAFRTRHDYDITGTKKNRDRLYIASCTAEQKDCSAPNTVAIDG